MIKQLASKAFYQASVKTATNSELGLSSLNKLFQKISFHQSSSKQLRGQSQSKAKYDTSQIPSLKSFVQSNRVQQHDAHEEEVSKELNSEEILKQSYESMASEPEQVSEQQKAINTPLSFFIETYGCQMNVNDSEIVRSILKGTGKFAKEADCAENASVVFLNTCAIRDSAEQKIHTRIRQLKAVKSIQTLGLLGCMAERLKDKMFAEGVNIICGPDAYRDLPHLIQASMQSGSSNEMNVQLSVEETYADITPVRKNKSTISAFLSIMRGCNNMCSFCIVPFVRGRQRSRDVDTVLKEIEQLQGEGVKQITFLGQNVNSYHDTSKAQVSIKHQNSEGFGETFKLRQHPGYRFAQLLQISAKAFPDMRFRFTSPHPKDFPDDVLQKIAEYPNICNYIHLPAQSGNTEMLYRMRRNHSRESYIKLANKMREVIPDVTLSTDMICGFCGETEEQFQDTLSLIEMMKYENAFLFAYSMRERTHAHRNYSDDVPSAVKKDRLKRMIDLFTEVQKPLNDKEVGRNHLLLIENTSKKEDSQFMGKTDNFKKGYINKGSAPVFRNGEFVGQREIRIGDYVSVKVESVGPRKLMCKTVAIVDKLSDYSKFQSKITHLERPQQAMASQN